jgi:hypothetical protein
MRRFYVSGVLYQLNGILHDAVYNRTKYRVIHKSLRDVRPLRYSSRDGHAEGSERHSKFLP